jgi:hypothetical protein
LFKHLGRHHFLFAFNRRAEATLQIADVADLNIDFIEAAPLSDKSSLFKDLN